MNVLVACEFSGVVREAFRMKGHNAWSCDLLPAEDGSVYHFQSDVCNFLNKDWELMVAFPPCTHLAVSGARWFGHKEKEQADALDFIRLLMDAPIPKVAIENPVGVISTRIRKPDQTIQPWQFGHDASKRTCLWLKGLPTLVATNIIAANHPGNNKLVYANQTPSGQNKLGPSADRWRERSRTFEGIAQAMAEQWSNSNG